MNTIPWKSLIVCCLVAACGTSDFSFAQSPDPVLSRPDVVTLQNGSLIYGEVVEMAGGVLSVKTASSADGMISIKWRTTLPRWKSPIQSPSISKKERFSTAPPSSAPIGPSISRPTPFKGQCGCPSNNLAPMSDHLTGCIRQSSRAGQRLSGDHALQQSAAGRDDRHRPPVSVHVGL